jgi:monolysocardiolipin acyltransferase
MAVEKLRKGDWIHIFPEGSRSRDGGKTIQSAKRGIGRYVCMAKSSRLFNLILQLFISNALLYMYIWCRLALDAGDIPPIVLPFVHSGMQEIMPIGRKFPSMRKRVSFD